MLFWQGYALPDLDIAGHFFLAKSILMNQFARSPLILSIKNGEIEGDYLLFKNKPEIKILNIDHKSAVLIKNVANHESLLLNGVHVLNKNPKITGVFFLGILNMQIGPRDTNDLRPKNSDESLAEYHSRKTSAELTKTKLTSGDLIYPSFSIFYRITPSGEEKMDGRLFQRIREKIGSEDSVLVSTESVNEFIKYQILTKWNTICENKNLNEILSEFPATFELSLLDGLCIKSRIVLDHIYFFLIK